MRKMNPRAPSQGAALKEAAVRKAGGIARLARILGVTAGAVSQWGRTRPIPRHARARLEHYVQTTPSTTVAGNEAKTREPSLAAPPDVLTWLSHFLGSGPIVDPALSSRLSVRDHRRLVARIEEAQTRLRSELEEMRRQLERELSEYQRLLALESRSRKRQEVGSRVSLHSTRS
jgi:hypothetical protein